ncbi:GNAT family N-acetyltransferase [Streptomyces sp.]|uniref:GNAT family N-acetyltransferase n=1 Tax=Streptomyces sp. TaxID=1931 RepID=UPI002F3FE6D0
MTQIRAMTEADVEAVSAIRVRGWQSAYTGIVPQSTLDAMDVAEDASRRREFLAKAAGRVHNLVAVRGETVVGWAAFGPYRAEQGDVPPGAGELYALYVRSDLIGTGIGRALTRAVVEHGPVLGWRRLLLWVLADNTGARRFYTRAGFTPDGAETTDDYDGVALREVRYGRDLQEARRSHGCTAEPPRYSPHNSPCSAHL